MSGRVVARSGLERWVKAGKVSYVASWHGRCGLSGRAGVCRSMAVAARRAAVRIGLVRLISAGVVGHVWSRCVMLRPGE